MNLRNRIHVTEPNRGCIIAVCVLVCAVMSELAIHSTCAAQSASPDGLTQYLNRLNLNDLLSIHLQQKLTSSNDDQQRERIGVQLVELYTREIQNGNPSDDKLDLLLRQLEQVLLVCPQLRTPELNILLIQAEYQKAFLTLSRWMEIPTDLDSRNDAVGQFTALVPQFDRQTGELEEKIESLQKRIDIEENETRLDEIAAEQDKFKAALLRASYYAAWNDYYLAIGLVDKTSRGQAADRARQRFADFLGFDLDRDYEIADPESLELEMPLRARAGMGLAVVELMNNHKTEAEKWIDWLASPRVDRSIREDQEGELILALLLTEQYEEAIARVRNKIRDLGPPASLPEVRLSRTLARYGEFALDSQVPQAESLRGLGYEGLVRQRQFKLASEILAEFNSSPPSSNNFFLGWLDGYRLFSKAESTKRVEDFETASRRLNEIASLPGAKTHAHLYGYFLMQLGWAEYQSKKFSNAAQHFHEATATLRDLDRDVAVDSAWMKSISLQQLAAEEPVKIQAAIDAFQVITLEFADHPKASEAKYQIARLQRQSGTSRNPIASLERVTKPDANYLLARFEICSVRFDLWKKEKDPETRSSIAEKLYADVDLFSRLGNPTTQTEKRLRARMMATEAAFGEKADDEADRQLDAARLLADSLPDATPSVSQFHYWKLMQARREKNAPLVATEARWLVDRARAAAYRQAGLVYLTQHLEIKFSETPEASQDKVAGELVLLYQELVTILGTDTGTLATNRNARVALYKLGVHQFSLEQNAAAAETFNHLVNAFPDNQTYLRYLGLSEYRNKNYSTCVESWGKILRGLESGTEPWFEARYYELDSLRRLNRDRAQKIWKQFQVLHPKIPYDNWKTKFDALATSLAL